MHLRAVSGWGQVVYDETGQVWVMLHSGSRWIGNTTAQYYDKKAVEYMKGRGDAKVTAKDINYLALQSEAGQAYLQVTFCTTSPLHSSPTWMLHGGVPWLLSFLQEWMGRRFMELIAFIPHEQQQGA